MISIGIDGKTFSVVRLNEFSSEEEIAAVRSLFSGFSCPLNEEVESFLRNDALGFECRNQAVTYFIFAENRFTAFLPLPTSLYRSRRVKFLKQY